MLDSEGSDTSDLRTDKSPVRRKGEKTGDEDEEVPLRGTTSLSSLRNRRNPGMWKSFEERGELSMRKSVNSRMEVLLYLILQYVSN